MKNLYSWRDEHISYRSALNLIQREKPLIDILTNIFKYLLKKKKGI